MQKIDIWVQSRLPLTLGVTIDRIINKFTGSTLRLTDGINAIAKLKRRAAGHLFWIDTIHNELSGPGLLSSRQRILVGDITQCAMAHSKVTMSVYTRHQALAVLFKSQFPILKDKCLGALRQHAESDRDRRDGEVPDEFNGYRQILHDTMLLNGKNYINDKLSAFAADICQQLDLCPARWQSLMGPNQPGFIGWFHQMEAATGKLLQWGLWLSTLGEISISST
jgi:hypothetical protein